jgi:threonine/homoserine/homoserine lactone efflux protein
MGQILTAIVLILVGIYHIIGVCFDCGWFWKTTQKQRALNRQGKKMSRIVYIISGIGFMIGGIVILFYRG